MLSDKFIRELISTSKLILPEEGKLDFSKCLIDPYDYEKQGPVSYDLTTEQVSQYRGVRRLVTREKINMPRNMAGLVSARSRLELRGLFAAFSFLVDPGFSGKLTFLVWCPEELNRDYNISDLFQIIFFKVEDVGVSYDERPTSTGMGRDSTAFEGPVQDKSESSKTNNNIPDNIIAKRTDDSLPCDREPSSS